MLISVLNAVVACPGGTTEISWLKRSNLATRILGLGMSDGLRVSLPGRGPNALPDPAIYRRATVICPLRDEEASQQVLIFVPIHLGLSPVALWKKVKANPDNNRNCIASRSF